jgi:hypothetical protein
VTGHPLDRTMRTSVGHGRALPDLTSRTPCNDPGKTRRAGRRSASLDSIRMSLEGTGLGRPKAHAGRVAPAVDT